MRGKYLVCIWVLSLLFVACAGARAAQLPPIGPTGENREPARLDPTIVDPSVVAVPEPGTIAMLVLGGTLSSLMAIRRNRRN